MNSSLIQLADDATVFAFSDPHGCRDGLVAGLVAAGLIDVAERWIAPPQTALVGCGDYIDRGRDSRGVIGLLRRLGQEAEQAGSQVVLLRGNHEELLIEAFDGRTESFMIWLDQGGRAMIESYGFGAYGHLTTAVVCRALADRDPFLPAFLRAMPDAARWHDVLFVHGGLVPDIGPDDFARDGRHLVIREPFFEHRLDEPAFAAYRAAGIERVVFGHTPMAGPTLVFGGRGLCLDTNAANSDPHLPAWCVVARIPAHGPLEASVFSLIDTSAAADRARRR